MGTPQESDRAGDRTRRLGALLPWLALFAASVALRSLRFALVFEDGAVRFPYGADELYHLRRIWFTVVNFPETLSFDRYLNHPEGAAPIWTPFFDWSIAALARGLVGAGSQHAVEVVAAWVPPLLGALSVLASAWLVRRTYSAAAGWVTGALLVALPAHVFNSALGMVDHHVAVGLFATLLLAPAMRLAGPLGPDGRPAGAVATGVMIAAAVLLWPGFLLHILVMQLVLVAQLLASADQAVAVARARALATAHALAAFLLLPFCLGHASAELGPLSPQVLSDFQPLWFGAGAATLALLGWLWSRPWSGLRRGRRVASVLALGAFGLGAAWRVVPGLADALRAAAGWFEADPFLGSILELRPLLAPNGRFDASGAHAQFSYLFWAYPIALGFLGFDALRRRRGERLLLLGVSAGFAALTLFQLRFEDVSSVGFAWVMGPALAHGFRAARRRVPAPALVWAAFALLTGVAAGLPHLAERRSEVMASTAALRGIPPRLDPLVRTRRVMQRVGEELKRLTPPTAGYLDPTLRPAYGVLCDWSFGHLLRYYGERPMVQDNFGPWGGRHGFEAARRYYQSRDEDEAVAIAERLGARYVVVTPQRSPPDSVVRRLVPVPRVGGALGLPGPPDRAPTRHRLLFVADDRELPREWTTPTWHAALYEIVPAARVLGRAPGETSVQFELEVPLPERGPLHYRVSTPVDASGRYLLRLPYPSTSARGYAVSAGRKHASLHVSESDVQEGRTVTGPSFAP